LQLAVVQLGLDVICERVLWQVNVAAGKAAGSSNSAEVKHVSRQLL
jgi:hypothetical protein